MQQVERQHCTTGGQVLAAFDEKPLVRSISRTLAKVKSMITNYHQFKEILKYKSNQIYRYPFYERFTALLFVCRPGRHNLRSFLAENSTQNYFLIARMFSFCDIRDKNAVFNILRQNVTNFDIGNG